MINGERKRNYAEDIDGNLVIDQPCQIIIIDGPALCDAAPGVMHRHSWLAQYAVCTFAVLLPSSTSPSALSFAMLNPLTKASQNAPSPIPSIASTITAIRTIDNKLMSMHHRLYHDFPCALV
jgi:hypothetical protein